MSLALLLSLSSARSAPSEGCPEDPSAEVERARLAIWNAYRTIDELSFDRAGKAMGAAVGCLDRALSPGEVVKLHQSMALIAFVNGQTRASRRSFSSVRLLDPTWQLDASAFPAEHPIRELFDAATDPGPVDNLGRISPKQWLVDGVPRQDAPTERGFLLQVRDEDGKILWSRYLWDWTEIPDFGQPQAKSVLETPHDWWISTLVHGGLLSAKQQVEPEGADLWADQSRTAFAAGGRLAVRYTPISVVGGEIAASLTGPADPVEGGGGLPAGHALVMFGGGGWAGSVQPYAAARLGFALDRMRSWYHGDTILIETIPSAVAGIGGGIRNDRYRLEVAFDGRFASGRIPYRAQTRIDGGGKVAGPLAVEGAFDLGFGGLSVADEQTEVLYGRRSDLDLRVGAGIAIWY